jgi:hypothetical protein
VSTSSSRQEQGVSTERSAIHRRPSGRDDRSIKPGLVVERDGARPHDDRFRFMIPAGTTAAYLTTEEATNLGHWLIWQASLRTA